MADPPAPFASRAEWRATVGGRRGGGSRWGGAGRDGAGRGGSRTDGAGLIRQVGAERPLGRAAGHDGATGDADLEIDLDARRWRRPAYDETSEPGPSGWPPAWDEHDAWNDRDGRAQGSSTPVDALGRDDREHGDAPRGARHWLGRDEGDLVGWTDRDLDEDDHGVDDEDDAAIDDEDDAALRWARPDARRRGQVAWRIGTAAAVVLATIAVVLLVRAFVAPAATQVTIRPVTTATSAEASGRATSAASSVSGYSSSSGAAATEHPAAASAPGADAARSTPPSPGPSGAGSTGTVIVHVTGAVHRPGIVRLAAGSRIADAVSAAGGALPGAQMDRINLAARAEDGTQIRVPAAGEDTSAAAAAGGATPGGSGGTTAGAATPPAVSGGETATGGGTGVGASPAPGTPVNINTADAAALDGLPRVGPVMAQRIVAWRTEHGPFAAVDDLDAVPGIGEKMMAELRPLVTTG
ncbi:ComEA family DNA-binding protein [Tersicoccus sp. MR15.9]|uniref:ComEA family DNA-binding protein n=1 Tax=Tersicoccus mangrovi TaxID=3121635 RepID=UPI002FE63A4C